MRHFLLSYLVTALALILAFVWQQWEGLFVCLLLIIMEVSFSFDNAVVNATVLADMDEKWRRRFITWGMPIAIVGMYYLFPIIIVSVVTGLNPVAVTKLAIDSPHEYSQHLMDSHVQIGAFGGMFLLMVFFKFIFDDNRELHWLGIVEKKLATLGKLESVEAVMALAILLVLQMYLPQEDKLHAMVAGVAGITLYVAVNSVMALLASSEEKHMAAKSGVMSFIYLNLLDASFSLDAVVGSFAISKDIVIIILGLSAGAMFVRSMTIYLVRKGTLNHYVYLEHGAHYGIGALAFIMLASMMMHVSEVITGLVGVTLILASFVSSVHYNRKKARNS